MPGTNGGILYFLILSIEFAILGMLEVGTSGTWQHKGGSLVPRHEQVDLYFLILTIEFAV